jgi:ABC-type uncharacterized transport system ATPase subunit
MGGAVIAIRGLTKCYGATVAVDKLSFDVRPGVVTGFLGRQPPRARRTSLAAGRLNNRAAWPALS